VTVAYYALIPPGEVAVKGADDADEAGLAFGDKNLPNWRSNHEEILAKARRAAR